MVGRRPSSLGPAPVAAPPHDDGVTQRHALEMFQVLGQVPGHATVSADDTVFSSGYNQHNATGITHTATGAEIRECGS